MKESKGGNCIAYLALAVFAIGRHEVSVYLQLSRIVLFLYPWDRHAITKNLLWLVAVSSWTSCYHRSNPVVRMLFATVFFTGFACC